MSIKLYIYTIVSLYSLCLCAAQYSKISPTQNPKTINDYKSLVDVMRERRQQQAGSYDFSGRKGPTGGVGDGTNQSLTTTKKKDE